MPIEHSYATMRLAQRLVAEVLAEKVASGYFGMNAALDLAAKILGENAISAYGMLREAQGGDQDGC